MLKPPSDPRVRLFLLALIVVGCFCGLAYVVHINELLKRNVEDVHRGILVIGFIVGFYHVAMRVLNWLGSATIQDAN